MIGPILDNDSDGILKDILVDIFWMCNIDREDTGLDRTNEDRHKRKEKKDTESYREIDRIR